MVAVGEANSIDPHRQVDICAVEPTGLNLPAGWMWLWMSRALLELPSSCDLCNTKVACLVDHTQKGTKIEEGVLGKK